MLNSGKPQNNQRIIIWQPYNNFGQSPTLPSSTADMGDSQRLQSPLNIVNTCPTEAAAVAGVRDEEQHNNIKPQTEMEAKTKIMTSKKSPEFK